MNTGYLERFVSGDLKVGKFGHLINSMRSSCVSIQGQCNFLISFTCMLQLKLILLYIFLADRSQMLCRAFIGMRKENLQK